MWDQVIHINVLNSISWYLIFEFPHNNHQNMNCDMWIRNRKFLKILISMYNLLKSSEKIIKKFHFANFSKRFFFDIYILVMFQTNRQLITNKKMWNVKKIINLWMLCRCCKENATFPNYRYLVATPKDKQDRPLIHKALICRKWNITPIFLEPLFSPYWKTLRRRVCRIIGVVLEDLEEGWIFRMPFSAKLLVFIQRGLRWKGLY